MTNITLPSKFISFGFAFFFSSLASAATVESLPDKKSEATSIIVSLKQNEEIAVKVAQQAETAQQKAERRRAERRAERERRRAERAEKRKKRSSRPRFGSFF
jgi:flagellar hook-length control protein FliK